MGSGREITILILAFVVVMPVTYKFAPTKLPTFAQAFFCSQIVIALKISFGGSFAFGISSIIIAGLVFTLFSQINRRWIQNEVDIDYAIVAVAAAVGMFIIVNAVQYTLDPNALIVANGRFNGTTGNPQHAATFLGIGIPALFYVVLTKRVFLGIAAAGVIAIGFIFLVWTNSRTGILISGVAIFLLLRRSGPVAKGSVVAVIAAGLYMIITRDISEYGRGDTRTAVWSAMWRQFQENLLTGVAVSGDRLGFGENSWLAMGAAAGLIGFIPLLIGGSILLRIALNLLTSKQTQRTTQLSKRFSRGRDCIFVDREHVRSVPSRCSVVGNSLNPITWSCR